MTRMVAFITVIISLAPTGAWLSSASQSESGSRAQPPHTVAGPATGQPAGFPRSLVGRWRAQPDRVPLSDDNAWGRNATAVRLADLQINADGTGTVTVNRSVVNRAGAAFAGSRVVETARFAIGAEERPLGLRPRLTTTVTAASRRYPDPPVVQSALDGLRLEIYPPSDEQPDTLEIDFSVFSGDGSFTAFFARQRAVARR
jgi:hypothetical protein